MLKLRSARLRERIGLIVLIHLVAMIFVVILFAMCGDGRRATPLYRLPDPEKVALITVAFERAPPQTHEGLVRAFSDSALGVDLLDRLPPAVAGAATPNALARYREALGGRPFRVLAPRERALLTLVQPALSPEPISVAVLLPDGRAVRIEQRITAPITRIVNNFVLFVAVIAVLDVTVVLWLASQTTGPVERLARAVRGDRLDTHVHGGPREIVELADAFASLRRRLHDLLHERTRMLAAIAHDYRTYLTRLQLRSEFIEDEEQRARAVADLDEMRVLLADTLTFARESVTDEAEGATCDVREELALVAAEREERGEDVLIDPLIGPVIVQASHLSFQRMIGNLLDNAVRYGGERAAIRIHREADRIRLCVDDDGPGVPEESLERLLEPFERLEPSRARHTGGTGLGLSIVQALAHRYGGILTLHNRPEGGFRALLVLRLADPQH